MVCIFDFVTTNFYREVNIYPIRNSSRSSISLISCVKSRSIHVEGESRIWIWQQRYGRKINYPEDSLFLPSSCRKKEKKRRPSPRKTEPSVYKRGPLVRIFRERVSQTSSIKLFPSERALLPSLSLPLLLRERG